MRYFILAIIFGTLFFNSCKCQVNLSSSDEEEEEITFEAGDIVRHKVTGDVGIIINVWGSGIDVRFGDYEKRRFADFELTHVQERDTVTQSDGTVSSPTSSSSDAADSPRTIFNVKKVWNPATQKYETSGAGEDRRDGS